MLSQFGQLGNPLRSPEYVRLSAVCIILNVVILVDTYRRGRGSWWTALPVPVLIAIGGSGLQDSVAGTALAMVATILLSLYGSTWLWLARILGAIIAIPMGVAISPMSGNRPMEWHSPTVIGILPQIVLMAVLTRGIYLSLVRQERTAAREALLARAGHAMLGVTDVARVREVGLQAAEELVVLNPGVALLVLRRQSGTLLVANLAGAPAELRGRHLSDEVVIDPAQFTVLMPEFREWYVDALGADPATAELYIAVGGHRRVPADVVDAFRNLSHQVVLAESGCFAHAELEHRAHHDHLTGLPTRPKFLRAVGEAITGGSGGVVALLNIDLDDFKQVNDGHGHAAGDELLVQIGARISAVADGRGMAARFGGDEFALLLTELADAQEADRIAHLLCAHLTAPVMLSNATVSVGASIGIAVAEPGIAVGGPGITVAEPGITVAEPGITVAEPGITVADLTRRADIAMYSAKAAGKNRIEAYQPTAPARTGRHRRAEDKQPAA